MSEIQDPLLPFPCPNCGQEIAKSLGWLTTENKVTCPGCGSLIHLKTDEPGTGLQSMDDAIANILRGVLK